MGLVGLVGLPDERWDLGARPDGPDERQERWGQQASGTGGTGESSGAAKAKVCLSPVN